MGRVVRAVGVLGVLVGVLVGLVTVPVEASTLMLAPGVTQRPAPTKPLGPPTPTKQRARTQAKGHARGGRNAREPVKAFVEPAFVVAALLTEVTSDERQLLGLKAYADAQVYMAKAQAGLHAAVVLLAHAVASLKGAEAAELQAIRAEAAAKKKEQLDESALYELGLAEYTGQAAMAGTDLASQERQVEFSELAKVAAVDEGASLRVAQVVLAADQARVHTQRLAVGRALYSEAMAKGALLAAREQLARSRAALLDAHTWATMPGEGPSRPVQELLALEAKPPSTNSPSRGALIAGDMRVPVSAQVLGKPEATVKPSPAKPSPAKPSPAKPSPQPSGATEPAGTYLSSGGPSILGSPVLSAQDMAGWFASTGAVANTAVPVRELARYYLAAGRLTGVRGDVAFAQSVVETGYFSFPEYGQDPASYNNFAGIGACGSCKHGWKFPSASAGVLAQERLLSEYAGGTPGSRDQVGTARSKLRGATPRLAAPTPVAPTLGISGCCRTWMSLSGVWASNPDYGYEILSVYKQMLDWVLSQELQATGLVPAQAFGPRILRGGAQ